MQMYTGHVSGPLQSKVYRFIWPLYQVGLPFLLLFVKKNKAKKKKNQQTLLWV